jgi:hypothetical protein
VSPPPRPSRRALLTGLALGLGSVSWLPAVRLLFGPDRDDLRRTGPLSPRVRALAERHLALWEDPALRQVELARMRAANGEWDFMGRTFVVLALANVALRLPDERPRCLTVIDRIVRDTLAVEQELGMYHFLMPYAHAAPWVAQPPRSIFVDGEIALMLAARQVVEVDPDLATLLAARTGVVRARMEAGPVLCAESYPDECWMFCNAAAIAALVLAEAAGAGPQLDFARRWLARVRGALVHDETGLLVSSFSWSGEPKDGPEGSSIFMVAHCLQLVDPDFARDQYERAREELGRSLVGFGWAREWPDSWRGPWDVDSGPIVPLLDASAGASGLALLGAGAFEDDRFLDALVSSLDLATFPTRERGRLRYAASNQVGDAVALYALVCGPLWAEARRRLGAS